MLYITLTPAYGRDYKSAKEAVADYDDGKDFIINAVGLPAKPINKSQCESAGFKVTLRYGNLRKTCSTK